MMERILLVDVDNERSSSEDRSPLLSDWSHHPIGLASLAANAASAVPGVAFRIFHTATSLDPMGDLERRLQAFQPDVVGFRALSIGKESLARMARLVREVCPGVPILAGGAYPSVAWRHLLASRLVDLVAIGEGETTFREFLEAMADTGRVPKGISGTAVRRDGQPVLNAPRAPIADLDTLEFPDYDLIDLSAYQGIANHAFQDASRSAFICASRGCIYHCFYCHQLFGKRIRRRSPEHVVAEMREHLARRGIRDFVFVDDVFNVPMKAAKQVLAAIARELPGIRIYFPNGLRADQIDEEMVDLFEAAGTVQMALAVETVNPRLQRLMGKHLNLSRARKALDLVSRRFVSCAFFMVGFPTETYEEAMETVRFAESLEHLVQPVLSVVRLYAGTALCDFLDPNPEQLEAISRQEHAVFQTRLFEDPVFYGDAFSRDKVPMTTREIQALRFTWARKVLGNKARMRNAHAVLQRYFDRDQLEAFYRNFYDDPHFSLARHEAALG